MDKWNKYTSRVKTNTNGEILLDASNIGTATYFPGGPECDFLGKKIPYIPLFSPSGGINGSLLVTICEHLDKLNVFERKENGPLPILLVDGHKSRLSDVFMAYVNDENHR